MNLKEMRAAAVKKAQELMEKARQEKREFTEEETKMAEELAAQIAEYDAALVKAQAAEAARAALDAVAGDAESDETSATGEMSGSASAAKSLGDHFFNTVGVEFKAKARNSGAVVTAPEYVKANTDTQKLTVATENVLRLASPRLVGEFQMRLTVADLIGTASVSGGVTSIPYVVEGAIEGDFQAIAEGGQAPQLHIADPMLRYEQFHRIAGFMRVTDEMLADDEYMKYQINTRLPYKLLRAEEKQLLLGDGSGDNLTGLLNRSGIQTYKNDPGVNAPDEVLILKAKTLVAQAQEFPVDAIIINPLDYFNLRVKTDGNGQYMAGGFFQGQYGNGSIPDEPNLWGIPTVQTSAIPQGTVLVGALKAQTERIVKQGVTVEYTNSHTDDFTKFQNVLRAYVRESLGVYDPKAICKVTLGAGA